MLLHPLISFSEKSINKLSPLSQTRKSIAHLGVGHRRGPGDHMRRQAARLGAGGVQTRSGGDTGGPLSPSPRCSTAPPRPPLIGRTPRPPLSAIASTVTQESDFCATGTPIKAPEQLKKATGNPKLEVLDIFLNSTPKPPKNHGTQPHQTANLRFVRGELKGTPGSA
jgi:hypothetical protein